MKTIIYNKSTGAIIDVHPEDARFEGLNSSFAVLSADYNNETNVSNVNGYDQWALFKEEAAEWINSFVKQ